MRLRAHRRNLVSNRPAAPAGWHAGARSARAGRIQRFLRTATLVAVIGLRGLVRGARARWRPLLAGSALTLAGVMLRGSSLWSLVALPGLWLLVYALLVPAGADHKRRAALARELAGYSTPAQRPYLEATLDQYPDGITRELRDILASQAITVDGKGIPGAGRC